MLIILVDIIFKYIAYLLGCVVRLNWEHDWFLQCMVHSISQEALENWSIAKLNTARWTVLKGARPFPQICFSIRSCRLNLENLPPYFQRILLFILSIFLLGVRPWYASAANSGVRVLVDPSLLQEIAHSWTRLCGSACKCYFKAETVNYIYGVRMGLASLL
jgi:hypothetical protein